MNAGEENPPPGDAKAPISFFCDTMLGKLAKWLRLLGYDTVYENEIDDWKLLRRVAREGRVLLTRDRDIMKRWQVGRGMVEALLIKSDRTGDQLDQVATRYGLKAQPEARCPEDNSLLEVLPRESARERVPPYVYETQAGFRTCPGCGRVYWKATHWNRIEKVRNRLGDSIRP